MPLTPEEKAELEALEGFNAGGGLTADEEAELRALEGADQLPSSSTANLAATPAGGAVAGSVDGAAAAPVPPGNLSNTQQPITPEEPGFLDYVPLAGIPADIYDIATEGFNSPDIVARRGRREEAAKTLVPYATAALGGAAGAGIKGLGLLGRAVGAGLGSGAGDVVGQVGTTGKVDPTQTAYAAAGGAIGQPIGEAAGALVSGAFKSVAPKVFGAKPNSFYKGQVDTLKKAGIKVTEGQQMGHEGVKLAEETLSATPYGMHLAESLDDQARQMQSALMKKSGFRGKDVRAGEVTPDAIAGAQKKFSKLYDDILGDKTVNLAGDDAFARKLIDVENTHLERLPSQQKSAVRSAVGDLDDLIAAEPITGTRYQHIRSILAARGRSAQRSDPMTADMWNDMAGALDDAFISSVDEVTGKAHKQVQGQYRNFKLFQKAAERSGSSTSGGSIGVGNLLGAGRKGTKDFEKLARAGQSVIGTKVGRSGTAERLMSLEGMNPRGALSSYLYTKGIPAGQAMGLGTAKPGLAAGLATTGRNLGTVSGQAAGGFQQPDFEPNRSSVYDRYR